MWNEMVHDGLDFYMLGSHMAFSLCASPKFSTLRVHVLTKRECYSKSQWLFLPYFEAQAHWDLMPFKATINSKSA